MDSIELRLHFRQAGKDSKQSAGSPKAEQTIPEGHQEKYLGKTDQWEKRGIQKNGAVEKRARGYTEKKKTSQ